MSKFSICVANAQKQADTCSELGKEIRKIADTVETVGASLAFNDASRALIQMQIKKFADEIKQDGISTENMGKALKEAATLYLTTERKLVGLPSASGGKEGEKGSGKNKGVLDWLSKSHKKTGALKGVPIGKYGKFELGAYSGEYNQGAKLSIKGGDKLNAYWNAEAKGEFDCAKLSGKYENGLYKAEGNVKCGEAVASGEVRASLFKDGEFVPQLALGGKLKGSALSGQVEDRFGNDQYNVHRKASGDLLTGELKAEASAGKLVEKDENGHTKISYGAKAEAGGEAYLAKGEVSAGFNFMGIKTDIKVGGGAGGAGLKAGGKVTTGGASGKLGAGFLVGADVDVDVDWSGFKLPKMPKIPKIF